MTVIADLRARTRPTAPATFEPPAASDSSGRTSTAAHVRTSPPRRTNAADRETHLLRLSLDLQLDAMLLVLGASAAGSPEEAMPWRRWLEEDVDLAWELTTTALAANGSLPPSLGPDLATAEPARITEDLLARYTSMCSLLEDLLARGPGRLEVSLDDSGVAVSAEPAWHDHVRAALHRYQARVAELQSHRAALERGAGDGGGRTRPSHRYLPGELLG